MATKRMGNKLSKMVVVLLLICLALLLLRWAAIAFRLISRTGAGLSAGVVLTAVAARSAPAAPAIGQTRFPLWQPAATQPMLRFTRAAQAVVLRQGFDPVHDVFSCFSTPPVLSVKPEEILMACFYASCFGWPVAKPQFSCYIGQKSTNRGRP